MKKKGSTWLASLKEEDQKRLSSSIKLIRGKEFYYQFLNSEVSENDFNELVNVTDNSYQVIKHLAKTYPNDFQLGGIIRKMFS